MPHETGVFFVKWLAVILAIGNAISFVWLGFTSSDIAGIVGWFIGTLALTLFGYFVLRSMKPNGGTDR